MKKVGLAIQGGGFPAGAFAAGVISGLIREGAFDPQKAFPNGESYDICAFSGTSAGALVAARCWAAVVERQAAPGSRINGNLMAALERQWMYLAWPYHAAWMPVCPPAYAEWLRGLDAQWMKNPLWLAFVETYRTPFFRWMMARWIEDTIAIDDINEMFKSHFGAMPRKARPGLVLGSADVVRGEIKTFREEDLSLSALLASGSLDDCNGVTTIVTPPHNGTYLDGAWGDNPPINELLDYDLDEIWFIQHFPKAISQPPHAPAERRERKDELWQNSLVEHEKEFVEFVNDLLDALNDKGDSKGGIRLAIERLQADKKLPGTSPDDPELSKHLANIKESNGDLPRQYSRLFQEINGRFVPRQYKHIKLKKIDMLVERELGSTIVNVPWFIRNLMSHGEERAQGFVARDFGEKPETAAGSLPGWWACTPKPLNDYLCGMQTSPVPGLFHGPLELFCDLCGGKTMSGALELLPDVLPVQGLRKALPPANTLVCDMCPMH